MSDHTIVVIQVIKVFFNSSSVYSCYLFLISSALVMPITFLSFIVPVFAWNVPLAFLIFHCIVFLCFFALLKSLVSILWK